jgi:hypothetical protein
VSEVPHVPDEFDPVALVVVRQSFHLHDSRSLQASGQLMFGDNSSSL